MHLFKCQIRNPGMHTPAPAMAVRWLLVGDSWLLSEKLCLKKKKTTPHTFSLPSQISGPRCTQPKMFLKETEDPAGKILL